MKTKLLLIVMVLLSLTFNSYGQKFMEMMDDPNVNFYAVVKEAEAHFKIHGTAKGSGYKQFKRWEYIMKDQIDEQGNRLDPQNVWREHARIQSQFAKSRIAATTTGNWVEMGPRSWNRTSAWNPGIGRVTCIGIDPNNNNIIFVGSPGGGCWKSTNGGSTWATTTDQLPVMNVFSVTVDPTNSNIVYMGTSGGGILKSTNGGNSWVAANSGFSTGSTTRKIIVDPTNGNIVIAATSSGIYRSTNGGGSWTLEQSGGFNDVDFKPGNTSTVYACGNTFYRSTDNGQSFTQITSGITTSGRSFLAVTPANPNYVYVVQARGSEFGYFYRSTNSGASFSLRVTGNAGSGTNYFGYSPNGTDTGGQAGYDMAICASTSNAEEVYIGGIIIWKTTNGGSSFTAMTEWIYPNSRGYTHPDMHALEFVGSTVYSGSDGGIYKSTNQGGDWTDLSTGLGIRQFYRISCSKTNAAMVAGGAQDNGSSILKSTGWIDWLGADGMESIIDHSNPNIIYGTTQNGGLNKSTNGGASRGSISTPSGSGNWVTPWVMDPVNASTLYLGYNEIWKTTNGGSSWTKISTFGYTSGVDALEVAPSNSAYLYASKGNTIWRTTNGGASWTNISAGVSGNVNYITVHPDNPQKIAVSTSGSNKVYTSNNGGASWTNISSGLPNITANCVVYQKGSQDGLYVGMNVGVYYRDNTLGAWIPFMTSLPKVSVRELEVHAGSGKLRAATYGRGLWESDLYSNTGNTAPTVSITSPVNGAVFTAPASITITANATDADGNVTNVEFFNGTTLLGSDNTAPYSFTWNNVAAGIYTITAKATDNASASTVSGTISITVNPPAANATVYQHCNYDLAGYAITLNAGNYTAAQLIAKGIADNDISSLKVQSGYEIVLYELDNFLGASQVFSADDPCLVDNGINDWASSVRVRAIVVNQPPVVSITAPANNATFTAPANITITANATDDVAVTNVEFFNGTTPLGSDNTSPHSFTWNGVSSGTYSLTVKATDGGGLSTTSSVVTITVNEPVVLRDPENPAVTVNGLDYSYYEGNWSALPSFTTLTPIETGTIANYDLSPRNRNDQFGFMYKGFVNVPADGQYTFYTSSDDGSRLFIGSTMVVDNDGLHGVVEKSGTIGLKAGKHAVTVTFFEQGGGEVLLVNYSGPGISKQAIPGTALFRIPPANVAPTVSITAPANNATFTAPANITITANATDSDGSITNVEFFNGSASLGSDNTSPYSFAWNGVAAGTYTLTAKATDNGGLTTTSSGITITVEAPAGCQVPTALSASAITTSTATLNWTAQVGAESYLVWWRPVGGSWTTNATVTTNSANIASLLSGTEYEFTVRTNCSGSSSAFATPYLRFTTASPNAAPSVSITAPANNATFTAPAAITITANATDSDGSITNVEFFNGSASLGSDNTSPYSFAWSGVAAGTYTLTAKATDNGGLTTTSSVITITVEVPAGCQVPTALSASAITTSTATLNWTAQAGAESYLVWWRPVGGSWTTNATVTTNSANIASLLSGTEYEFTVRTNCTGSSSAFATPYLRFTTANPNAAPSVSITSPANNASFSAPANVSITANATDDGSVTKVEFFNGAAKLGEDVISPYSFAWNGVVAGTYSITAKATDNHGVVSTSSAVSITVTAVTTDACSTTPQYVENNGYVDGSQVKNGGNKYQCKPWPYSGWCNGAAWAYAPGTGAYWSDAWTLVGPCIASAAPAMNEEAPEVLAAPHPFLDQTTISVNNGEKILSVAILDMHGKEIMSTSAIDLQEISIGNGLEAGLYIVHVVTESGSYVKHIIKTE